MKFCDFTTRGNSPAAIFHEILEISNFASDLNPQKSGVQNFFRGTAAQPQPPAHISQQSDGLISQTIVRIQNRKRKRNENARTFCSPIFGLEAPPNTILLGRWEPNPSLQVTCHITSEVTTAAPQGIEIRVSEENLRFYGT